MRDVETWSNDSKKATAATALQRWAVMSTGTLLTTHLISRTSALTNVADCTTHELLSRRLQRPPALLQLKAWRAQGCGGGAAVPLVRVWQAATDEAGSWLCCCALVGRAGAAGTAHPSPATA